MLPAVISPLLAGVVALDRDVPGVPDHRRAEDGTVKRGFRLGQIVSASMVALAHGTNDAQKTMGIITLTLITAGVLAPDSGPPFWVILSSGLAIALGTYARRLADHPDAGQAGQRDPDPAGLRRRDQCRDRHPGLVAPRFALSTTQVATGAIFGAGAGRRLAAVHWGVAGQMAIAWMLTMPSAAVVGAAAAWLAFTGTVGTVIVVIVLVAAAAGIYAASRRRPVTAENVNDVPAPAPATAAA